MTKKTIGWSVKQFLKWKRDRVAETTLEHYASRLRVVLDPIRKTKLKAVTPDIVRATLKAADDGRRRATRSASRRALSNYQRFLLREEIIAEAWLTADDLRSHGSDRRARFATDAENEQILAVSDRDFQLLYKALLATGARPGELVNACIDDVHNDDGRRTIIPKHHKTEKSGVVRMIPVTAELAPILDESIGERTEGRIFLRSDSTPWEVSRATDRFRAARRECDIPEHIKMYLARHAFVTKTAKEKGATIAAALAGHKSTAMVEKHYLLWRPEDMHDFAG